MPCPAERPWTDDQQRQGDHRGDKTAGLLRVNLGVQPKSPSPFVQATVVNVRTDFERGSSILLSPRHILTKLGYNLRSYEDVYGVSFAVHTNGYLDM